LNPQSGKGYIKVRAAVRQAVRAQTEPEGRVRAVVKFGVEAEEWGFNYWLWIDEESEDEKEDEEEEEEEEDEGEDEDDDEEAE